MHYDMKKQPLLETAAMYGTVIHRTQYELGSKLYS